MTEPAAVDRPSRPVGTASSSWRAHPNQLRAIRAELRRRLASFGLPLDAVHDVVLAVNEAVSNVVDHAYPPTADGTVDITLRAEADNLRIEVVDHGRWRAPSAGPTGRGRGITMMNGLMDSVFIHCGPQGTRVVLHYPLS